MNGLTKYLIIICFLTAVFSCTEEAQPIFITGQWEAFYFERVDCRDSLDNIKVDLVQDSVYVIGGRLVRFNSYELEVLDNGQYSFILSKNIDGKDTLEMESGNSLSSGFNDISFCKGPCTDSLFKTGLYVRVGDKLDLSFSDSLDLGCGVVFRANLK